MAKLDRIVNVQIALNTAGISKLGFSTMLIAGWTPAMLDRVATVTSVDDMLDMGFATDSEMYKAAQAAFSQTPRPRQIKLGRLNSEEYHVTTKVVKNDDYTVTFKWYDADFNVVKKVVTFTNTGDDKAAIITGLKNAADEVDGLSDVATVTVSSDDLVIKCEDTHVSVTVSENLDVDSVADGTIANGMNEIKAADSDFYGVVLASHEKQDILDMAAYAETQTLLYGTSTDEAGAYAQASTNDVLALLQEKEYYRTYCDVRKDASDYEEAAKMARCFAIEPGGETWALKSLAGVKTDGWTETEYTTIKNKNGNTYEHVRNIAVTQNGKVVAGEWIDIIRFRDWLVEEIQTNVFTVLKNNDKVPYTDAGIAMIENVVRKALEDGQDRGGIAPTEYDENNNENPGFVLSVPLASEITPTQKATRDLKDIKFTARMAGAIHTVEIKGSFTYENLITTDNVVA